jgi:SAM-dependent methyltransferase
MANCCSSACAVIEEQFGPRRARRDLLRYRKKGPEATAKLLRDGIAASGGPGETLLDIGAGIGPLTFELLERGVRRAVSVEASAACVAAGREEAARRNRATQVEWVHGDFVAVAASLEPTGFRAVHAPQDGGVVRGRLREAVTPCHSCVGDAAFPRAAGRPFSRCVARCATLWHTAARTSTAR